MHLSPLRVAVSLLLSQALLAQHAPGTPLWTLVMPDVVTDFARQRLTTVDEAGTTWEWDSGEWREMARGLGFGRRHLVYDTIRERTIQLFEPLFGPGTQQLEWDGHSWRSANVPRCF